MLLEVASDVTADLYGSVLHPSYKPSVRHITVNNFQSALTPDIYSVRGIKAHLSLSLTITKITKMAPKVPCFDRR